MCVGGRDLRYRRTWRCGVSKRIVEQFTDAGQVVLASSGYFRVTGFAYSFMAVSVMLFSAIRDRGGQRFRC